MAVPDAVPTLPRPGDLLADKYRLEQELGRGAMGAVFRARHLVTGKQVAIKCQLPSEQEHPDDMARFLAEARAAAAISHPSIVDVYDVGESDGALYLVMEYLDGVPLRALLGRGPLPLGRAVRTMLDVMRGIAAAHRSGVVHRDLKPDNVLLQRAVDGTAQPPKVLDFGIAKLRAVSGGSSGRVPSLTTTGAVIGTPHYMSPEQAEASPHVDARADVYALGVMLYELLAGVRPYEGNSVTAVLLRAARGEHAPLRSLRPEVPPALAEAVAKAMSPRPEDRFQRIGALIDAIHPFAAAEGLQLPDLDARVAPEDPTVSTPFGVASRRGARSPLLGRPLLLLILAAAVVAFALLRLREWRPPPDQPVPVPASAPATAAVPPPTLEPPPAVASPVPPSAPGSDQTAGALAPRPAKSRTKPKRSAPPPPTPSAKLPTADERADPPSTEPAPARGRLGVGFGRDDF